jgi:hypothetical protein
MKTLQRSIAPTSLILAISLFFSATQIVLGQAATDTWVGNTDTNFGTAANWTPGAVSPGNTLLFGNAGSSGSSLFNNLTAGTAIDGITFNGSSSFILSGNGILITGQTNLNTVAITNESPVPETNDLPLALDWGYYTFTSPNAGSIALNSSLTLNSPGSVAYFDANNTSSVLVNDTENGGPGLISSLGGAGLIYSSTLTGSNNPFAGLAAMSGTSITTYGFASPSGTTVAAAGAIGSTTASGAQNVELTANASGNYTLNGGAGTTYFNTIYLNNVSGNNTLTNGSAAGAQTIVLGANTANGVGGFYLQPMNNASVTKSLSIGSGASTLLTAGTTSAGGVIVLGVNGYTGTNIESGNPGYNVQLNASPTNNSAGGPVSIVKVGNGLVRFTTLSTYTNIGFSGGTYVLQGVYEAGAPQDFGTGPAYVASGATLYLNNGGIYTNPIYLSPGQGYAYSPSNNNFLEPGVFYGALALNGGDVFTNTLTLLGPPTTYNNSSGPTAANPGDRIGATAAVSVTNSGQITGPGTLELNGAHTWTMVLANPITSGPGTNNFQGGVIVDALATHAINIDLKMGANNQLAGGNVTLVAPTATTYARFDLNATSQTIGALIGTGSTPQTNQLCNLAGSGAATLTMGAGNASGIFSGSTTDSGTAPLGLIKIGTGTQTLDNTGGGLFGYHGNTTVSNGTLALTGSLTIPNTPLITVAAPATLDASGDASGLTIGSAQTLNCVGTVNGTLAINGTVESLDAIGTLTNNGSTILNGGGTNIWYVNNFSGTPGRDPGYSQLNVQGSLQINSTSLNPFVINITSLTSGDVAGSAANFNVNANGSWVIATASGGINNFTSSSQFSILTSAFANAPSSSLQWSVSVTNSTNLVLNYTAFNVITTAPADSTNNAGSTATFTAGSTTGIQPVTYTWYQNGNLLVNTGGSAGGGTVNIITNGAGTSSTLSIIGVQDADTAGDISVTVSDSASHTASVGATLTVIDAPYNPNVTQSGASVDVNLGGYSGGGRTYLSATANGGIDGVTPDFTYQWYLGTNLIMGGTNAVLPINLAATASGNYTVVISNSAGSVTSSATSIGPVTSVPGQMIFEPFDSYVNNGSAGGGALNDTFSAAAGFTNLFNQLTGEPSYWTIAGTPPKYSGVNINGMAGAPGSTGENQFGGEYPWPGLGGDSPNEFYWTATTTLTRLRVTTNGSSLFAVGGANTNIYFSFTMSIVSLGSGSFDGTQSVFGGFATSAGSSACGLEFWTWIVSGGASQVMVGVGKGNGTTVNNPTQGVNINPPNVAWGAPNSSPLGNDVWTQQAIFVVGCYTVVDGPGHSNDTVTLWINPPSNSYYASTPPTPYLGPTNFGGTVANSTPADFVLMNDYAPASHRITDLRIGTTWASVTPPSAPTLILGNVYAPVGTTVTLASQDAGNPVTGGYGWQFDGGPALSDGPTGHGGSSITGSSTGTLVISNIQSGDYGLYTVNGTNIDLSPALTGNLVGSTTALVTGEPPSLKALRSGANVVIQWPTNWLGYVLEQTPSVSSVSWTTNSLPPYAVSGTNNEVIVPASGAEFYRLINP